MKVLLWIFLVLFVLLFFPAFLSVRYKDEVYLKLFVFLIPIKINLQKKQEETQVEPSNFRKFLSKLKKKSSSQKDSTQKQQAENISTFSRLVEDRGLSGAIGHLVEIAGHAGGAFGGIMRSMPVLRCDVHMRVGGDDAAEAAINYGRACAAIYPLLAIVLNIFPYYRKKFDFAPDYCSERTTFNANALLMVFPGLVLWQLLKAAAKLIIGIVRERVSDNLNNIKQTQEGGAQ